MIPLTIRQISLLQDTEHVLTAIPTVLLEPTPHEGAIWGRFWEQTPAVICLLSSLA